MVTIALIVVNVAVFVLAQQGTGVETVVAADGTRVRVAADVAFTFRYAAVPCELVQRRPLDVAEVSATVSGADTACSDSSSPALFPGKWVLGASLTSMFLHGGWLHLGSNMLFLWIFGNNIEDHLGPLRYLGFYVTAGVVALAAHVALEPHGSVPVVGASGAIAGVMGAYMVWFPRAPIRTIFFVGLVWLREVPARWLLAGWFALQFLTGADSGVAWAAHVGGFAFGVAIAVATQWVPGLRRVVLRDPTRPLDDRSGAG